ncbi:hypothetical protein Tco_0420438 [Tanacetum coccineum]
MYGGSSNHWVKIDVDEVGDLALEMEALVDAIDVENGGLSFKESFIGLFRRGRHLVVLVVEWMKRVKIGDKEDMDMDGFPTILQGRRELFKGQEDA